MSKKKKTKTKRGSKEERCRGIEKRREEGKGGARRKKKDEGNTAARERGRPGVDTLEIYKWEIKARSRRKGLKKKGGRGMNRGRRTGQGREMERQRQRQEGEKR